MGTNLTVTLHHYGDSTQVLKGVLNTYAQGVVLVVEYLDGKKEMYPFETISLVEIVTE